MTHFDQKCKKCQKTKLLSEFQETKNVRNGNTYLRNECRECVNGRARVYDLRRKYNLSTEDYEVMLAHQKGVCYICSRPPKNIRLQVDHDHKTGMVRGLLCWACNSMLPILRDNPDIARRAADYLEAPPATLALGEERFGMIGPIEKRRRKRKKYNG